MKKAKPRRNPFGILLAIMVKGKKFPVLIKALKFLKPMLTIFTMALSAFAYSSSLGWKLAIGLVVMIFIHEMGHVIALKCKGMSASVPILLGSL